MYWSEISMRFSRGRSTPAMRAIFWCSPLALALLVPGVGGADDPDHALAPDDLALVADLLHRRADLHDPRPPPEAIVIANEKPDEKPRRTFRRDRRRGSPA